MGYRQIWGLRHAEALEARPAGIPHGRARGKKAFGVRYENTLAKVLAPWAVQGQWWGFSDAGGPGCCQTDLLLMSRSGALVVLECKYSWVVQGHGQLEQLYRPVVEWAVGLPLATVVVCKNLSPDMGPAGVRVSGELPSALASAPGPVAWHWLAGRPQGLGDHFLPVNQLRAVLRASMRQQAA